MAVDAQRVRAESPAVDLTVIIGSIERDVVRLPADAPTCVGRGSSVGELPDERWVPRRLVDMVPERDAWRVVVRRGPAEVGGDLMTGTLAEGAQLVLGPGSHSLAWDLQERLVITVDVAVPRSERQRRKQMPAPHRATTVVPGWHRHVLPDERVRLAIAFSHLLEQRPRSAEHWAEAATQTSPELTADELRRWVRKRKERLERNLARGGNPQTFRELDDYGLWLIRHRQISVDDLP